MLSKIYLQVEILNSKIWSISDLMLGFPLGLFLSSIPYLFHSRKSGSSSHFILLPEINVMVLFLGQAKRKLLFLNLLVVRPKSKLFFPPIQDLPI